jgi:hypothetical protein
MKLCFIHQSSLAITAIKIKQFITINKVTITGSKPVIGGPKERLSQSGLFSKTVKG